MQPSPHVYARPFGDEMVLLNFDRGEYYGLNAVGATVWRFLGEKKDISQIVRAVVEEYDVSEAEASRDIQDLVGKLLAEGLVQATF